MLWQYGVQTTIPDIRTKININVLVPTIIFPQKIPPSGFMLSSSHRCSLNIVVKNGVRSYLPFISPVYGSMYTDARLGLERLT